MRTAAVRGLALFTIVFTIGSCIGFSIGTTEPPPVPNHPLLGGPGWRVFDAVEVEDPNGVIDLVIKDMERCTGMDLPPLDLRFFTASIIRVRKPVLPYEWTWSRMNGMALPELGWVYVRTGRSPDETMGTVKHEVIHLITGLDHPQVNRWIQQCAGQHKGQEGYKP